MLTNVLLLMEDTEEAANLRSIVIGKKAPRTRKMSAIDLTKISNVRKGNLHQKHRLIVLRALNSVDYLLIHKPSNEDLTPMLATIVNCFVRLGKSVLLTAQSNSPLETVLLELTKSLNENQLLRLGGSSRSIPSDSEVAHLSLSSKIAKFAELPQMENYNKTREMLMNTPVVASTCLGTSSHSLFSARRFDICLVMDASAILQPVVIRPILQADAFILVGNLEGQPCVHDELSSAHGMAISLMERMKNQSNALVNFNDFPKLTVCV
uniref:DNA2/NAM7 helicase helicase domain-containing protein n=1 Tax=Ditylenchus dipsaci TaxID=166011 RepID=A0A915D5D1_9BILA